MPHFLHHLLHPFKTVWNERIALFWPIWVATTALGALLVIWAIPRQGKVESDSISLRHYAWSRGAILAVTFLALFLACSIAGSLLWEDFTYYDNSHFTNGTLAGRNIPLQISRESGRFWPLGHQEFNLLRHVTRSVAGYHALRIVQLVLLCAFLLILDQELSIPARVALILLLLITPSILISFSGLIYAESNIVFWLACLVWLVNRFEQTRSIEWAVAAVIASQFLLYYKETAFLLLLGFAFGRLLFRCWKMDRGGWDLKALRNPESRLDLCLAILVVPFLLYYLAAMFPNFRSSYADTFRLPFIQVVLSYLGLDLLAWIFVCVGLVKVVLILWHKVAPSLLWDGLALAGIAYFFGYIILRMTSAYYLAPVDFIAVLYLGRLAYLSRESMGLAVRMGAVVLLALIIFQDLSFSAFRMYERKNVIHAKAEMGSAIKARYQSDPQNARRLFFPFAKPFQVMEFASYLNYIGVPVEQLQVGSVVTSGIQLVDRAIQKDGPCGYRAFVCHTGETPDPGDLVVLLPDDATSASELSMYQQPGSAALFSYDREPSIPQWMYPFVRRLHVVSPVFALDPLPDSWLTASITAWK
jgi:hypothetical protein